MSINRTLKHSDTQLKWLVLYERLLFSKVQIDRLLQHVNTDFFLHFMNGTEPLLLQHELKLSCYYHYKIKLVNT